MKSYENELKNRIGFIKNEVRKAGVNGIVYGNSGGKDSTLVGILCKLACDNTLGLIMPCNTKSNHNEDMKDALLIAKTYNINTKVFDLSNIKSEFIGLLGKGIMLNKTATINIPPRLRMTVLYSVAASQNRLVAGTGNRSEIYMGYFTKWGDGAFDFNPIADLTVTEIIEFLQYLNVPGSIVNKPPSAGLYDGQTDENEMGISYHKIDEFILNGTSTEADRRIIQKFNEQSKHKRKMPVVYGG